MTGPNHKPGELPVSPIFIFIIICVTPSLCLLNEELAVEPTVSERLSASMMEKPLNASVSNFTLPLTCGNNTHYCMDLCSFCHDIFHEHSMQCLSVLLDSLCLTTFHIEMTQSNADSCVWGNVSGFYSNLSICTEEISDCLIIPWPNPLVEQTFLDIHSRYFQDCPSEELSDPPPAIVFALVITPICLIPVMVSLVVLKTKNGDGSQ
ncbi:unnamed protein product [Knipowitschia caucasica]|uniref:Receptor activity modifying protein 2 n=1 Tax=Knipowitschia caucasica TaxID=637954 RepID=A0AAV2KGP0_KNICA